MKRKPKRKIEQLMASVLYGLQVVGLVLISFVTDFSFSFVFSLPPFFLFLTLPANMNQHSSFGLIRSTVARLKTRPSSF